MNATMGRAASEADTVTHLSFGAAAGVVLVLIVVIVLLIITDLSCYFVNRCGITMCICHSLGRSPGPISSSQSKEKALEESERFAKVVSVLGDSWGVVLEVHIRIRRCEKRSYITQVFRFLKSTYHTRSFIGLSNHT